MTRSGRLPPRHKTNNRGVYLKNRRGRSLHRISRLVGVRGRAAGTAYFIPARVGVWLVGGASRGPLGDSGLSPPRRRRAAAAARHGGSVFFEVRFRGRGLYGCVLLTEIYKMSSRT